MPERTDDAEHDRVEHLSARRDRGGRTDGGHRWLAVQALLEILRRTSRSCARSSWLLALPWLLRSTRAAIVRREAPRVGPGRLAFDAAMQLDVVDRRRR
jgi:hypothetical protein